MHLVPEPLIRYLSRSSGCERLGCAKKPGSDLVRGILNLSILFSAALFLVTFLLPSSNSLLILPLPLICGMLLILIYPKVRLGHLAIAELKTSLFTFDIFSSVYLLTGSIEVASSYLAGDGNMATARRFRKVLLHMRNGAEPRKALIEVFSGNQVLIDWIRSVTYGSLTSTASIMEAWKAEAMKNLSKSEDLMAFVILVSTLLPIVMTIVFLIWGAGSSLAIFLLVMLEAAEFLGVYLWLKDLVFPIE